MKARTLGVALLVLGTILSMGCQTSVLSTNRSDRFVGTWSHDPTDVEERHFQKSIVWRRRELGEGQELEEAIESLMRARDVYTKTLVFELELMGDMTWRMQNGGGYGTIPPRATGRWSVTDDAIVLALDMTEELKSKGYDETVSAQIAEDYLEIRYEVGRKTNTSWPRLVDVRLRRAD